MATRAVSRMKPRCDTQIPCCPACGALECLCRPRFFAGQLLSEQDLNRLDQYIRNKTRLHNLNQHGWGVVNGLLVLCDPCNQIKVTEGYAVDACGDDIVVCEETLVSVCELINACNQDPMPNCEPFRQPAGGECDDLEEEWVLTIQYQEWPSRRVTALRGSPCAARRCPTCAGSSCTCGAACPCGTTGSGSCSCGPGSGAARTQPPPAIEPRKNRHAPPECEATITCEGFSFGVYPKPVDDQSQGEDDERLIDLEGPFWDAFCCCAEPLMATIPPMPPPANDPSPADVAKWCCQFKQNLTKYFSSHRNTSCEILDYLKDIECPNVNDTQNFATAWVQSFLKLVLAWAEGLKLCLCLSLLPPAPVATCDPRVPLATVRVRSRDCKVLSICNWTTERKIMVTWPAMTHWLSILPIGDFIRSLLDQFCCSTFLHLFDDVLKDLPGEHEEREDAVPAAGIAASIPRDATSGLASALSTASGSLAARLSLGTTHKAETFRELASSLSKRGTDPVELGAVLNAMSPRFRLPDNAKGLSRIEAKNLPIFIVSEVAVKPALAMALGGKEAEARVRSFHESLGDVSTDDGERATHRVAELRSELEAQAEEIANLLAQLDR